MTVKQLLAHPRTQFVRRFVRRVVTTCAVILAVALVTTLAADVGPVLRARAESAGAGYLQRTMRIGRLEVRLWDGSYVVEDLEIGGLTPESLPFLTAGRIVVSMPWSTLINRRVVFDAIEMTDWRMHVESLPGGVHSFPKFGSGGPRGQSAWTTTLQYVHAYRGEFVYQDHGTPLGVVARNLDVTVARPANEYVGQARFSDGLTAIQGYVPFRTDMDSTFKIDGGRILFDRIDLDTEGVHSVLVGDVDANHWPEMMFQVESTIELPRMRELFFETYDFSLAGQTQFSGHFHLFRERLAAGDRNGRELKGTFRSARAGLDDYTFDDLRGSVRWTPDLLEVTEASTNLYGGRARFLYRMAPFGADVPLTATFDTEYQDIDLVAFSNFLELDGIRLAGRLSGHNLLEWPMGRFADRTGHGDLRVVSPEGVTMMTRGSTLGRALGVDEADQKLPVSPLSLSEPVPIGGELVYTYGPDDVILAPSRVATERTLVEFEGQTAYGEESTIPFHVSSADWQESDRVFAGLLTTFGVSTRPIPIGGYGTFDGRMLGSFRRPRIEGDFSGERIRAWDVTWGTTRGAAVIENNYVDVSDVAITSGAARLDVGGRFSMGFPRADGGDEIDARFQIARWPLLDLRHAFGIDDYDLDGPFDGQFAMRGRYLEPEGSGTIGITDGTAYGERFDMATADIRFEDGGARLENIRAAKQGGTGTGAAFIGWDGTYSFNFDARAIPVESVSAAEDAPLPVSGLLDFGAGGSGTFEAPRYDVRGTLRDFFVADEGIGQVVADLNINGDVLTVRLEAASPRLAVSTSGRIALTPGFEAELSVSVADTSLDPYLRAFQPQLSPFTTAVASGSMRVVGSLADIDKLLVDATIDRLDVRLFDYAVRNAGQIRLLLDRHTLRATAMRIVGQGTQLDVEGEIDLHNQRIAVRTTGDANLAVLQGFAPDTLRSSGMAALSATLDGPLRDPIVSGAFTMRNGRIRYFALPHALENITGEARFDSRGVSLDGVTARLARGDVVFGGRIDKDGYVPGRFNVTMRGTGMRPRLLEGMTAHVDADLTLQGSTTAAVLSGRVTVNDAVYQQPFGATGGLLDLAGGDSAGTVGTPAVPSIPLTYDIQITAPATLQVRNNSLRLVASADLQLRGTFDQPLLFGRATAERGQFLFEGRRYVLTRGTIDFNNPTRIEPFFDLETEARVRVPGETYRVTVRATGPWLPALEFSSDPPLPEAELLALLLSDVAPGQDVEFRQYTGVTPQQQLLQERAARALTGTISSEVGRVVEQAFGVDTFQITPLLDDPNTQSSRLDPSARLTIGKQLSDRIFVTYSRSLSSSTRDQVILLEYDQTDRFSWILSRNEDRTYALELRVRRAF